VFHRSRALLCVTTLSAVGALALAGCGSGKTTSGAKKSASVSVASNTSLHDRLPAAVKSAGKLTMATDPTYAPIEFSTNGKAYQGFDIDLANAIAKVLGVKVSIQKAQFDGILAGINAGRFDFAMSAFTDNKDREKQNDFVTYFTAGTSIGVKTGNPKHIESQDDLCGKRVAAEKGTIQVTALTKDKNDDGSPTLRGTCLAKKLAAPIAVPLPDQNGVDQAVIAGRADAFTGDTPVVAYQGKLNNGQLQLAGKTADEAPYGIAFKKGSPLVSVFHDAVTQLMKDGTYTKIINTWSLSSGAVTESKINAAVS
jgi:polar amino acid transport system substrate-binding protein